MNNVFFTHRRLAAIVAAVLVLPSAVSSAGGSAGEKRAVAAFRKATSTFVKRHCVDCHAGKKAEAGLDLTKADLQKIDFRNSDTWTGIFTRVHTSEMPPKDSDSKPTAAERQRFLNAVDAELTRIGRGLNLKEKLLLPEFGNYVNHELLFSGRVKELPYTPARIWRLRPGIYGRQFSPKYGRVHRLSVKIGGPKGRFTVKNGPHAGKKMGMRYFSQAKFSNPFFAFVHKASGITDYATIAADQASLESLLINAEKIAQMLTIGTKVSITTEIHTKDSRRGNNSGGFVGGDVSHRIEYRGEIPVLFNKISNAKGKPAKKDLDAAITLAFQLILHRSPTPGEITKYADGLFRKNAALGNRMALQSVIIALAISPEYVYRMELGLGKKDKHGRRMLSPRELFYAIHYAFTDAPPYSDVDTPTSTVFRKKVEAPIRKALTKPKRRGKRVQRLSPLDQAVRDGRLSTRKDVEREVRRILNARDKNMVPNHNKSIETVKNPRVLQFFREFFGYYKAPSVFKDVEKFKTRPGFTHFHNHTAHRIVYDTDALVLHILKEDKNVLAELLTTNKVFISYWSNNHNERQIRRKGGREKYALAHDSQNYNLHPFKIKYERGTPLEMPKDQRCGILTQPSWLVAHSGNFDNDPVRRGKWIREKLLAGYVQDIPITVDAKVPEDKTKTLRERFHVVRKAECWKCHRRMNPLGMPFESFNHIGRFRTKEKGKPVDTRGAITFSGDPKIDGDVKTVREMMERLARSPRVRQSFIRHIFRYWMGRNEMPSDSKTLIAMDKAYVSSKGSFKETLVALLTSDSFLYRK